METLNKRVDYLEDDIKEVKEKIKDQERAFNEKMDKNHQELKLLIRETELHNKEKTSKLFTAIEKMTDAQHQQTLAMTNIANKTEKNTETITEFKDSDRWKTRTIAGFAISLILMILGTFWGMWFDVPQ